MSNRRRRGCCGRHAAAAATGAAPAARPAAAPRPPAAPIPDLAGQDDQRRVARRRRPPARRPRTGRGGRGRPRRRRHLAAADAARLDGPRVGRVFRRVGRRARRDRPLHVSRTCSTSRRSSSRPAFPNEYGMGVDERWKDKFGVWLVRTARGHRRSTRAASTRCSVTCTHLGCTPNYLSAENKFKCPCHGSGFRTTGDQLRRARAAAARARARRAGRRRPDPGRQEPEVPVRAGAVGRSGSVSQAVISKRSSFSERSSERRSSRTLAAGARAEARREQIYG